LLCAARVTNSGSGLRHRDLIYGKEDQSEAISAKPFPEKTAEYPDRIDCFQVKVARRGVFASEDRFGVGVKGNDRQRRIHAARALPARHSIQQARRVQLKSDAAQSSAFLMRKWIGEHDDRLTESGPSAITFQVSRNLSLARGRC